jgi:hypothetical protein
MDTNGTPDERDKPPVTGEAGGGGAAPGNVIEAVLAVWEKVLSVADIRPDDDFFELGGHSLLGALAATTLSSRFGVDIPVDAVFDAPTAGEFAALVDELLAEPDAADGPVPAAGTPLPAGEPGGNAVSLTRASITQEHRLLFNRHLQDGRTQPVALVYEVMGPLDVRILQAALDTLLRRHDSLRSAFPLSAEDPIAAVTLPADTQWPIELCDLREFDGPGRDAEVRRLVVEFSNRGFDLAHGPLANCLVVLADENHAIVGLSLDHLVFDGESLSILEAELAVVYDALQAGRVPELPTLPQSYAAYAAHQRAEMEGPQGQEALRACHQQFDRHGPYPPQLRIDKSRFDVSAVGASRTVSRRLPSALVAQVSRSAASQGCTFFMACLGAIAAAIRPWCEEDEIGISMMEAARHESVCESMVANLAFESQVWCAIRDPDDVIDLLGQMRDSTRAAMSRGIPMWWATRRYHSSPPARVPFTPDDLADRFQVPWLYFSYEPITSGPPNLGPCTVRPYGATTEVPVMRTPVLISRAVEDRDGWSLALSFAAAGYPEREVCALLERAEAWFQRLASEPW